MHRCVCSRNTAGADSAAFQHGCIGGQPYMIPDENRSIRICYGALTVSDGVVVTVIDYYTTTNHHILTELYFFAAIKTLLLFIVKN